MSAMLIGWLAGCDDGPTALDEAQTEANPAANAAVTSAADATDRAKAAILPGVPDFTWPPGFLEEHANRSPNAKLETHAIALAEAAHVAALGAENHDGEGRAWVAAVAPVGGSPGTLWRRATPVASGTGSPPVPPPYPSVQVAERVRFTVVFEVGAHGLLEGGQIFLVAEPFWDWSPAQSDSAEHPGYTTARLLEPDDASATPVALVVDRRTGGFRVEGRALRAGERIEFVYGAGPAGARADRMADRGARILIATDADGDGYRRFIDAGARVDVAPARGRNILALGPAEIAPGESFELVVAIVDAQGNRAAWPENATRARFDVEVLPESTLELAGPATIESTTDAPTSPHRLTLTPRNRDAGVLRLRLAGRGALEGATATTPPIVVRETTAERLVWADLHGHSGLSDGTGTPEDYLAYAREIARLDVVALTDHDHFGLEPLDEDPELVARLFDVVDGAERAGRFVTLPGYEWTSWLHGHRHVLYFDPARTDGDNDAPKRPLFSSIAPETDRPDELWAALRGLPALTFAHHTAGEPVATNWFYRPDPELEPVVEVASVHGQSESAGTPGAVRGALPGAFALDELLRGTRLGFVGSGDSHDGHPGLAQIAAGQAGLAGLFVERLTRAGVHDALRRRRSFATNGIRPWLDVRLDDTPMGATFEALADARANQVLRIRYEATAPIDFIEIVRSGRVARIDFEPERAWSLELERVVPALRPGEFQYVRVYERGGGRAWSSPVFAASGDSGREGSADAR